MKTCFPHFHHLSKNVDLIEILEFWARPSIQVKKEDNKNNFFPVENFWVSTFSIW